MTALRMFVLGLLLVNVVLLTVRALQPGAYREEGGTVENPPQAPLPSIELIDTLPPEIAVPEQAPAPVVENADKAGAISVMDPSRCIRVGPFADIGESMNLQSELQTRFERVRTLESASVTDLGYWVNIPPFPTRAEAQTVVEKLNAAAVKEFYVVPRGLSANAIALGVFSSQTRAENRRRQIHKLELGVEVVIELQTKTELNYWLEAGPLDTANPPPIPLFSSYPDLQQLEINCPMGPAEQQKAVIDTEELTESVQEGEVVTAN
jgi:hypothetical protein